MVYSLLTRMKGKSTAYFDLFHLKQNIWSIKWTERLEYKLCCVYNDMSEADSLEGTTKNIKRSQKERKNVVFVVRRQVSILKLVFDSCQGLLEQVLNVLFYEDDRLSFPLRSLEYSSVIHGSSCRLLVLYHTFRWVLSFGSLYDSINIINNC